MLIKDPEKRITLEETWKHEWIKDYSDMYPPSVNDKKKHHVINETLVNKLTEFGYSKNSAMDSLSNNLMNHISATYFQINS